MIALLMAVLLQEPPAPPRPRPEIERLRRELEALPPDAPERRAKEAELRRWEEMQAKGATLDPARTEAIRAWLRENEPESHQRVERLVQEGRRPDAMRLLLEAEARMREAAELKARDPKAFERMEELRRLERDSLKLAERARGASPADREVGAKLLRDQISRLFDLREELKVRELEELKRRVADIEKALEARKASKDQIVERRIRELLGERVEDD